MGVGREGKLLYVFCKKDIFNIKIDNIKGKRWGKVFKINIKYKKFSMVILV